MSVDKEAYTPKCRNCIGLEEYIALEGEESNYCDCWETYIGDADTAFCSFFVPRYGREDND